MRTVRKALFLIILAIGLPSLATPAVEGTSSFQPDQQNIQRNDSVGFKDWKQSQVYKAKAELENFKFTAVEGYF